MRVSGVFLLVTIWYTVGAQPTRVPQGERGLSGVGVHEGGAVSRGRTGKAPPAITLLGHLPALWGGSDCRKRRVLPLAPSGRGLRPQAVGERTVRLPEIFRAMAMFSSSAPTGHLPTLWGGFLSCERAKNDAAEGGTLGVPSVYACRKVFFVPSLQRRNRRNYKLLDKNTFLHKFDGVPFALRAYLCYNR